MNATEIIDALGGTNAVAAMVGVKPPSVSGWKSDGRIPADKVIRLGPVLHARGILARWDLRPEDWHRIWPELIGADGAPEVREAA